MNTRWNYKWALPALVVVILTYTANGSTYYVNGSCGNNSWAGTSAICQAPNGPKATIQEGIFIASDGDTVIVADGTYTGTGNKNLRYYGREITLQSASGAENCIIDCQGSGRGFEFTNGETLNSIIEGFTVTHGLTVVGGAFYSEGSSATFLNCNFILNEAEIGGVIYLIEGGDLTVSNCTFSQNTVEAGAGCIFFSSSGKMALNRCTFANNNGGFDGGGVVLDAMSEPGSVTDCLFTNNIASFLGGGMVYVGEVNVVNSVFSGNQSPWGGGLFSGGQASVINCAFGGNTDDGIRSDGGNVNLQNSIVWENFPEQLFTSSGSFNVEYSDIQGGWSGTGNINLNPLFVNPGNHNLRLSFASPCIDAGNNFLVPEGIVFDLDGELRFADDPDVDDTGQGTPPIVDMGAYEGAHESEDAQATEDDLDQGEIVFLIPNGGGINLLENAIVFVTNTSGPDNATFTVTQMEWNPHPSASRFSELGSILRIETSLEDGQFFAQLFIPFELDQINGLDPLVLDAINFHKGSGNWVLGPLNNTQDSPGRHGPIGDKIQTISGQGSGLTLDLGDYGVLYDPKLELGYVWMNVDQVGDFGLGEQLCIADCQPFGGDNYVHVPDLLIMLSSWGLIGASDICDVDRNDIIDEADLLILLSNWGLCEESANATWPGDKDEIATTINPRLSRNNRNADLDNNGIVDKADLELLHEAWGSSEKGNRADLDADGKVGTADLIKLLANWGQTTKQ